MTVQRSGLISYCRKIPIVKFVFHCKPLKMVHSLQLKIRYLIDTETRELDRTNSELFGCERYTPRSGSGVRLE